jgi:hypothetical protein
LLGCGDERMVERLSLELDAEARAIATRAILTGVPFAGLEVESQPHVDAALALVSVDQTLDGVSSNLWKMSPIWDLARRFPGLLRVFVDGRPIFGKQIKTNWSTYGFLDRAEVDELRREMAAAREKVAPSPGMPPLAAEEAERLHGDLKTAMEQISDDDAMRAFFARLVAEGVMLGERAKDLAYAAAKRRGWPAMPHRDDLNAFFDRLNTLHAKAVPVPHPLLPFLTEFEGWLARISGAGQDLFFFTA